MAAASGATTAKFAPATKAAAKAAHPALADTRRGARSGAARKQEVGLEIIYYWRTVVNAKYFA